MRKIVWVPCVIWDRMCFLYFDQIDQKLKNTFERISDIPLFFYNREEAEAFILAHKLSDDYSSNELDILKIEIIEENSKIINHNIIEYTDEEIEKYYRII